MDNDIPEVECQNCGWQGDTLELLVSDKIASCPECGSIDVYDYED